MSEKLTSFPRSVITDDSPEAVLALRLRRMYTTSCLRCLLKRSHFAMRFLYICVLEHCQLLVGESNGSGLYVALKL